MIFLFSCMLLGDVRFLVIIRGFLNVYKILVWWYILSYVGSGNGIVGNVFGIFLSW